MFAINFDKSRAEHFLKCLDSGPPIGTVHTIDEMLGLAGACFFALTSHGPILRREIAKMQGKEYAPPEHPEHLEADSEIVYKDVHTAIEFVAELTRDVRDGGYDERCEPTVKCFVQEVDGKKQMSPIAGFKEYPGGLAAE